MRLGLLIDRVEKLGREVLPLVREACERERQFVVDLNRLQLQRGVNAEGWLMGGGRYSESYRKLRVARGLPVDHVYLNYEGGLQGGMDVVYGDEGFSIITTDWKMELVESAMLTGYWPTSVGADLNYGPVFGLDEVSVGLLARRIAPRVGDGIRRRLTRGR